MTDSSHSDVKKGDAGDGTVHGLPSLFLIDPDWHGHRLEYFTYIQEIAAPREVRLITSAECVDYLRRNGSLLANSLQPLSLLSHRLTLGNRIRDIARTWRVLKADARGSHALFTNADEFLLALAAIGRPRGVSVTALVMRPPTNRSLRAQVKRFAIRFARYRGVAVNYVVSPLSWRAGRENEVPDPSGLEAPSCSRSEGLPRQLQVPPIARPIVACLGYQDSRKNALSLIGAARRGGFSLIIAGRFHSDDYEKRVLMHAGGLENVVVYSGELDDEALQASIAGADCLALLYSNEAGSSGLLMRAALAGTPIVGWRNKEINDAIQSHGLGVTTKSLAPDDLERAIGQASRLTPRTDPNFKVIDDARNRWRDLLNADAGARGHAG